MVPGTAVATLQPWAKTALATLSKGEQNDKRQKGNVLHLMNQSFKPETAQPLDSLCEQEIY